MKKSFLRDSLAKKQSAADGVRETIGRDQQALILPINLIRLGVNVRRSESNIDDLAESIKANGLLQPLLVRRDENGHFVLIAGYRRYQALLKLEYCEVPVRIQNVDGKEEHVLRLIENLQRQDLNALEEISAVANLVYVFDGNQSELASVIGKSKTYVSRCLKVFELSLKLSCDVATFSKSVLFELADSDEPEKLLLKLKNDSSVGNARKERKSSGPLPGGRAVDKVISYKETRAGKGFTLRVHFDIEKTGEGDRDRIVVQLQRILQKLNCTTKKTEQV